VHDNLCLREKVHIWLGSLQVADFIYCLCDDCCFLFVYQKMLGVYVLEKVKTIFFVLHQQWLMKSFLGKSTKGAKFLLILTALFGHQPTYKNLRGNTAYYYRYLFPNPQRYKLWDYLRIG